jgi:hypothetical protein
MPAEDTSTLVQPGFDPRDAESAAVDLEAVFAQVLESEAPVVALGRPGEQVGAGRVETQDDTWKRDFEILADNALLLLVLPSPGRSVEWEIKWTKRRGHLQKSLFVMPPKKPWHLTLPGRRPPLAWAGVWSALTASLRDVGLSLPPYENGGMVFFLGEDGTASAKASLQGWLKPMWVATLVGALLNDMSKRHGVAGSQPR